MPSPCPRNLAYFIFPFAEKTTARAAAVVAQALELAGSRLVATPFRGWVLRAAPENSLRSALRRSPGDRCEGARSQRAASKTHRDALTTFLFEQCYDESVFRAGEPVWRGSLSREWKNYP